MRDTSSNVTERLLNLTRNKYYGKYRGEVINNNDPHNRGRLEVKIPSVLNETETAWAMPCLPFGGKGMGVFMIPENGTGVWVEFEGGELCHPIWSGCYWGDDESPKDNKTPEPKVRLIRSEKGLTISLDDQDEIITISDKNGNECITIDVTSKKIKIKASSTVILEADNVKIGNEFAVQPAVLGYNLEAYLTALALAVVAKVPNLPVPTPSSFPTSFLSTQVKTT